MTSTRLHVLLLAACASVPARAPAWGEDGHRLILRAALEALPAEVRRPYAGLDADLSRAVVEPDSHSSVPAEACKHWIDVEKYDPPLLTGLRDALRRHYGDEGYADEDARGFAGGLDAKAFKRDPPPWPAARLAPLWDALPPTLEGFRARYGRLEIFLGVVPYQPLLYTRALARALAAGDRRRIVHAAGYLAHYVGDLHVPVHVTSDYKGQYSRNAVFSDSEHGDVHVRFETAFVKAELAALGEAARRALATPGTARDPGAITPAAIRAARDAYALLGGVLEADRDAARRHDPGTDWTGYLAAVRPAFAPAAAGQLAAAAVFLRDLLLTAAEAGRLEAPAGSRMMGSP